MKKKTMQQKATTFKRAALVAGILLPGTGIATICHNLSQIYMVCDTYWNPSKMEGLVSIFASYGDEKVTKQVDDNSDKKEEDNGNDKT